MRDGGNSGERDERQHLPDSVALPSEKTHTHTLVHTPSALQDKYSSSGGRVTQAVQERVREGGQRRERRERMRRRSLTIVCCGEQKTTNTSEEASSITPPHQP